MFVSGYLQCPSAVSAMSSELLVDLSEDPATAQLGQLKLATIEDQQWPADESSLSKSGIVIHNINNNHTNLFSFCLEAKVLKSVEKI